MSPVVDEDGAGLGHAQGELVQGIQQGGLLRPVPEDAGLVLVEPVVLGQGGGVAGPELADALVEEAPPCGGPLPDEGEVLGAEQHGIQNAGQLPGVFQPYPVREQLFPARPGQPGLQSEVPFPGKELPLDEGRVHAELDELAVVPGPVGGGGG